MEENKKQDWSYGRIRRVRHIHAMNAMRIRKDPNLYDDVENFVRKHDTGTGGLVAKLIDNDFGHRRYSDQEYIF